jgi:hypothetical protein
VDAEPTSFVAIGNLDNHLGFRKFALIWEQWLSQVGDNQRYFHGKYIPVWILKISRACGAGTVRLGERARLRGTVGPVAATFKVRPKPTISAAIGTIF